MSTSTFELVHSIPLRVDEIKLLLAHATDVKERDEPFYDALCRAAAILLASHLEAFLKELSLNIISDLNDNLEQFSKMPEALKREFCYRIAFYDGVEKKEVDKRIKQLLRFFNSNSVKIDLSAFNYLQNPNKNPSVDTIQSSLDKLGVPNVLHSIDCGSFTCVFDGNMRSDYVLKRQLVAMASRVYDFPYRQMINAFSFNREKPTKGQKTLWHEFVETVMNRRHSIVHGDTLDNKSSAEELQRDAEKLLVMMYAISYSATCWFADKSL